MPALLFLGSRVVTCISLELFNDLHNRPVLPRLFRKTGGTHGTDEPG